MIRVNRQIKCPKSWGPGSSPSPTGSFYENYIYLWNHFVNFNQTLPKCSLGDPLPKLFFSFLLIYKTRPNDFDLKLVCCISDAFSIFKWWQGFSYNFIRILTYSIQFFILTNSKYKYIWFWFGFMVFNATFNNISVISWQSVLLLSTLKKPHTCSKSLTNFIT
jgi:hypothetical protein